MKSYIGLYLLPLQSGCKTNVMIDPDLKIFNVPHAGTRWLGNVVVRASDNR